VRIDNDPALGGLAKDLGQAYDWHGARCDDVSQHLPRPDERQLVDAKVLVITGGPGAGKTTLVNSLLKILPAVQEQVTDLGSEHVGIDAKGCIGRHFMRLRRSWRRPSRQS
jgi:hypothetical protein